MKKLIVLGLCLLMISGVALADIGIGYETFTILPHALTLTYRDKDLGWGAKASADFGTSAISLSSSMILTILSLGNVTNFSFYTLSVTKDITATADSRSYIKAGVIQFNYKSAGVDKTLLDPAIGYGWEKDKIWGWDCSGTIEIGYMELLTLGLKHYF